MQSQITEKILSLENVSVTYGGGRVLALENASLDVMSGDFVAITGPNGGGKTTMLKVILQLLAPSSGKVMFFNDGKQVDKLKIGYLPQKNMIDSRFPVTVEDVVAMGLPCSMKLFHRITAEERELIGDTIETVGLTDKRNSPIGALSGGQLQRALLGRAIISSPEMLVLDEPLSYIDKAFEHHLYDIIANIAKHTTIILVSHELTVISQMANRHVIVDKTLHECHAHHHYVPSECE